MSFTLWLCTHPLTWAPQWVQAWRQRHIARVGEARIMPRLLAAQSQGIGINDGWVEPGTPCQEILMWFDEQIAATPRIPLDVFRMVVARCTAEEQGHQLSSDAVIVNWQGTRATWWSEGRDYVGTALGDHHDGLYVVASGAGYTWHHSPNK